MITAVMLVLASSGWILFVALEVLLTTGFSREFALSVRALPSSWALLAVEASARSDWLMTALPLGGLAVLVAALLLWWSRLLGRVSVLVTCSRFEGTSPVSCGLLVTLELTGD